MEKEPDQDHISAGAFQLFPSENLGVTGDKKIDLASKLRYSTKTAQGEEITERPTLHNVVATINVGCPLDLKDILNKARNVSYNPKRFAALRRPPHYASTLGRLWSQARRQKPTVVWLVERRCIAPLQLLYRRFTTVPPKNGRKFTRIFQKLGYPARFTEFKIQNLVATSRTNFPIRLEGLMLKHQNFAHYEPEVFPGLIYRMMNPKVVLLIFVSGQIVFTGAQVYENIELKEFKQEETLKPDKHYV